MDETLLFHIYLLFNFRCEVRWVTGEWEHCSASCGSYGFQERQVHCVTAGDAKVGNWTDAIVDPNKCFENSMIPDGTRPCNRKPCPGNWVPTGWSHVSLYFT